ncbi:hypothetical protein [Spirosoma koreense]
MTISGEEFLEKLRVLCRDYGVREFGIYGRFSPKLNGKASNLPPGRMIWLEGDQVVAEEAAYHFQRKADGFMY